jgi:hypothetical protein
VDRRDQEEEHMNSTRCAGWTALVVAGAIGLVGTVPAGAQRPHPQPAFGPPPTPATPPATPYPGATVTIDWRRYGPQQVEPSRRHSQRPQQYPSTYYVPIYYPSGGYGGGGTVYDTNGRPLSSGYDEQAAAPAMAPPGYGFPAATPDLSGSPYVVIDGGAMVVDFGNGDRRAVPACASVESAATPDGQPRTLFYRPPAYALVLRAGERGRVIGRPGAGARVCYMNDAYGRVALAY